VVNDGTLTKGQATRAHLVAVARDLFAAQGYDGTPIEAVLKAADVSRGALYHHFANKEALFEAVFLDLEAEIAERVAVVAAGAPDPAAALRAGCLEWVRMAGAPVIQRVVLLDAPSVLGWERWRAIEEDNALGMLKVGLAALEAESGRPADAALPGGLVDTFAHVLLASLNEIALMVARSPRPRAALRDGERAVDELLRRLLAV
jgi:AcrR family transcriptional regulator